MTTPEAHERPASVGEAAELLRSTRGSVLVRGAGTSVDWAGRVETTDLVLQTSALDGVLEHAPADMTVALRAGTPLHDLQEQLGRHGQWLALDPPAEARGATVGGLLAAGDSGPSRLRYGNLRDLVIGVTLVLADGTVARSGGRVIKNVAGYDLAKLIHGSLGTLALVAEVVLRLHPKPLEQVTTVGEADLHQAADAVGRIAASTIEPTALEWLQDGDQGSGRLVIRSDGSPAAVSAATARLEVLLRDAGIRPSICSPQDVHGLWAEHAEAVDGGEGDTVVRVTTLPTDVVAVAEHASDVAAAAGLTTRLVSSMALGVHTLTLRGDDAEGVSSALQDIRRDALGRGGSVLLRRRPPAVDAVVDPLGPPPGSVGLLRRIKSQFDPHDRFAPGRLHPWY